jgi:hypothetical protein
MKLHCTRSALFSLGRLETNGVMTKYGKKLKEKNTHPGGGPPKLGGGAKGIPGGKPGGLNPGGGPGIPGGANGMGGRAKEGGPTETHKISAGESDL